MGYDGTLKFNTEINEKGLSGGLKRLGGLAKGGLAVIGGLAAGAAAAFGVMTKSAVDSYASLEQNLGGVETLFKNSAQSVIANAKNAYMSAGLSANAYMETVTSFSASLLQSLGGDTAKAAEYADRAVVDMSDNANKMGTSMEMIQNAYQGFAKQNYTMLDNLKLGYGGTKEEMKRLVQDASKLTEVQEELGLTVDENSLSFGNIVNAISVMQKHMGIAGTTSKEAAQTITGSISAMKASFDNFLNGTGGPEELAQTMVTAGKNIIKAVAEIVPRLLETLPEVSRLIFEELKGAFSAENLTAFIESGKGIITNLISGVAEAVPTLLQTGYDVLNNLITGFVNAIPEALPKILDFVQGIGDRIAAAAPTLIQKGFDLLQKLVQGIVSAIPILIAKVPTIISTFANVINDNFPTILAKGFQLLWELIKGIISAIPDLIANIPKIVTAIIDVVMAFQWLNLGKNIITLFKNGIMNMVGVVKNAGKSVFDAVKNAVLNLPSTLANLGRTAMSGLGNAMHAMLGFIKSAASSVGNSILGAIRAIPGKVVSIGSDIVRGVWNGIANMTGWIVNKVKNFAKSILNGMKKALGIHSPSRVFRDEVGKYMAQGVGVGFEQNLPENEMMNKMRKSVKQLQRTAVSVTSETAQTTSKITGDSSHRSNPQQDENVPVVINNTFEVDGKPLVTKTTKAVIKKINRDQSDRRRVKGKDGI